MTKVESSVRDACSPGGYSVRKRGKIPTGSPSSDPKKGGTPGEEGGPVLAESKVVYRGYSISPTVLFSTPPPDAPPLLRSDPSLYIRNIRNIRLSRTLLTCQKYQYLALLALLVCRSCVVFPGTSLYSEAYIPMTTRREFICSGVCSALKTLGPCTSPCRPRLLLLRHHNLSHHNKLCHH